MVNSKPNLRGQAKAPTFPNYNGEIMAPGQYGANGGGNPLAPMGSVGGGPTTGTPSSCSGFTCKVGGISVTGVKDPNRNAVCHSWGCDVCEDCDETSTGIPDLGEGCPEWCLRMFNSYVRRCEVFPLVSPQMKRECEKLAMDYTRLCTSGGWPCPKIDLQKYNTKCGPEVKYALINLLEKLTDLPDNLRNALSEVGKGDDVSMMFLFYILVTGPLDLNKNNNIRASDCPSPDCAGTVTLCGKCVDSDVPEDISFGYLAARFGYPRWFARLGADAFALYSHQQLTHAGSASAQKLGHGLSAEDLNVDALCAKVKAMDPPPKTSERVDKNPQCKPCFVKFEGW